MQHLARAALVLLVSLIASLIDLSIPQEIYNTFYTVIGIFFSIGFSIVIGFDLSNVANPDFVTKIRRDLIPVTRTFVAYFIVATVFFLASSLLGCTVLSFGPIRFSIGILIVISFVYILGYMVYNFLRLQKMKDKIGDQIRDRRAQ